MLVQPRTRALVLRGSAVAVFALVAFFILHAIIVRPIWAALPRGVAFTLVWGIAMAFAHERLCRACPWEGVGGGALLGAWAGVTLAPFLVAGMLRTGGADVFVWSGALVALVGVVLAGSWWIVREDRARRAAFATLVGALVLLHAFPGYFLVFIRDFHEDAPSPLPFTLAVALIYTASGALLAFLAGRARFST